MFRALLSGIKVQGNRKPRLARALISTDNSALDTLVHSFRWVRTYPFLSALEAEIWRDDFDPVAKWVKAPDQHS